MTSVKFVQVITFDLPRLLQGEITTAEKEWLISYIGVLSLTAFLATLIVFMYINAQVTEVLYCLHGYK